MQGSFLSLLSHLSSSADVCAETPLVRRIKQAMLVGAHCNQASHVRNEALGYLGTQNQLDCMARFRCCNGEVLTFSQMLDLLCLQDKRDMLNHEWPSSTTRQNNW
jgi:hypothetical protein